MKKMYPYIRPYLWAMIIATLVKGAGAITDLLIPYMMGILIDTGIATGETGQITAMCIAMLVLTVLTALFNILSNALSAKATQKIGESIRNSLYSHIQELTIKDVDRVETPSLITRVTNDVEHVQRTLLMMTRFMIRAPIMAIGGVILSMMLDPVLTMIIFVGMILLAFASTSVYTVTRPIYRKVQHAIDVLTTILREGLSGIRVIKSFNKAEYEIDRFTNQSKEVRRHEMKAGMFNAYMDPSIGLITNMTTAVVLFCSAFRVQYGALETGEIFTILSYITMILNAMTRIPRMFMMISRANTSSARISEILDIDESTVYGKEDEKKNDDVVLEFRNVSFRYPGSPVQSLKNVSFKLMHGQTLAVIGGTGSGKTTLQNLILRLYEPEEGEILFQGRNIKDYSKRALNRMITAAMQQYSIFGMTIKDNIILDQEYEEERLNRSAESAQILDMINDLDDHFEYKIAQNGTNLSGGQKQRISVARTLYRQADLTILDDVSSALDYRTDLRLRMALRRNYKDKAVLMISQRISTVRSADQILVLKKGQSVGLGSHNELIVNCEAYRDICHTQDVEVPEGGDLYA